MNNTQMTLNVDVAKKINQGREKEIPITQFTLSTGFDELGLQYDRTNDTDVSELNMILNDILHYPSTQIAELHQSANRLGEFDILKEDLKELVTKQSDINDKMVYCPCCGFIKQQDKVKVCTNFLQINNIGISTFLFFQTIKNLIILLTIMAAIYAVYALGTNIQASNTVNNSLYFPNSTLSISLGAKQSNPIDINKTYYYVQAWIGAGLVLIWGITIVILKYYENKQQLQVDIQTKSASDYSIVIESIPSGVEEKQLQEQFDEYYRSITNVAESKKKPLTIRKFNKGKPFYLNHQEFKDDQLEKTTKDSEDLLQTFRNWIRQRQSSRTFSATKEERDSLYKKYDELQKSKNQQLAVLAQKVKDDYKKKHSNQYTTLFITFDSSYARKLICSQNSNLYSDRIRYYLTCCKNQNKFTYLGPDRGIYTVKISRAPEPQDIKWTNLGMSDSQIFKRKLLTFLITFILLGISFACVYGLSQAQVQNQSNRVLSFLISLIISVINAALGRTYLYKLEVIRILTLYECDYTETNHQTSLAIKTVLAQLINSILVPIIANYYIKNNVYNTNGLADDIFYLGITTSFISPILKILDGSYLYTRIMAWYQLKPSSKLYSNQAQLNSSNELLLFQAGYEYIYLVNLFLFTCFFVSLQPIIIFFAISGLIMMYWAQKYVLFERCKRPVPGTNLINKVMSQCILLGGFVYSLGSLTWSNFLPNGTPTSALLPNLIALGLGILVFIAPYETIFNTIFSQENDNDADTLYQQNRFYFTSEYDRLNPATAEEANYQFKTYVQKTINDLKSASDDKKKQVEVKIKQQRGRGRANEAINTSIFGHGIAAQLFNPQSSQLYGGAMRGMLQPQQMNISNFNEQQHPFGSNFQQNNRIQPPNMNQMNMQPIINQQQQSGFNPYNNPRQVVPQYGNQQQPPSQFGYQPPQQQSQFGYQQQQFGFQQPQIQFQPLQQFGNGMYGFQQQNQFNPGGYGYQMPFNPSYFGMGGNRNLF